MAKYNKQTVEAICGFIRDGDSQKLACKKVGIGDSTFHDWIKAKPDFRNVLKSKGRVSSDDNRKVGGYIVETCNGL